MRRELLFDDPGRCLCGTHQNCAPNECLHAILNAYNGETYLSRNAAHAIANDARPGRPKPSDRELEAVRLTCFGWEQRTVADRMRVKPETVKTYLVAPT